VYLIIILVLECLDLNLGSTIAYLYCNLGAHEYLDLDPGVVNGFTSNTKSVKMSKSLFYKYLASKNLANFTTALLSHEYLAFKNPTDYTTALHRVVSYPKPIKLGPTGSSTKRCGVVKKSKYIKNRKLKNNFQKIKIFKNSKSITDMTARALVIILKCNNFFPIKIGQEKIKFFTKFFDLNLKMAMFKTAIRSSIRRTEQKLGQENHFLQNLERKYATSRDNVSIKHHAWWKINHPPNKLNW
jgi:hypothetical protein